ncbi:MAG: hypothetical protein ACOX48_08040 [Limnochordia bacterium]|jgi:MoxR-like ATPase/FtsZ-binding cell division protein ZapB
MEQRIIVVKKNVMGAQEHGKLQPLMYADGTPIENLYYDFPNRGDIFVPVGFSAIPEEPIEISVQENKHYRGTTEPHHSKYLYHSYCELQSTAGRVFDVIPVTAFPKGQHDLYLDLPFYPTLYFFLQRRDTAEIWGPFKRGECKFQEEKWRTAIIMPSSSEAIAGQCPLLSERLVGAFHESELPPGAVQVATKLRDFQLEYDERKFIFNFPAVADLINSDPDRYYVDLMADHDIVTWLTSAMRKQAELTREDVQRLRQMVIDLGELGTQFELPETVIRTRIERAVDYLQSVEEAQDAISGFFQDNFSHFLHSEVGQKALDDFVRTKREDIMADLLDQVLEKEEQAIAETRRKLGQEIADLEGRKANLQKELAHLAEQAEKAKQQTTAERVEAASAELENLKQEIAQKRAELDRLQEHVKMALDFQALKAEIEGLKEDREYVYQAVEELKRTRESLEEEFSQSERRLRDKLLTQKLYLDTLSGVAPQATLPQLSKGFAIPPRTEEMDITYILKSIQAHFEAQGRDVTLSQVANYLISILQNRLTIFVGYPGVGKTSTIQLLAEALGMCQPDAERLLKVSVGRGWVSSRDLIGYHNPLTDAFQPAPTGMYYALKALHSEENSGEPKAPLWVLLDEVNLSPVEHYWSDFMTTTDSVQGSIRCGTETLAFDHALRFIGTANYDETTEPLSPRVISRANIIYVEPPEARTFRYEESASPASPGRVFTLDQLRPLWDVRPEHTEGEQIVVNRLVTILQGTAEDSSSVGPITVVDPRVRKSMAMYCAAARDIMRPELGEFGALDFAVAQRVLPQCRGTGQGYARRLEQVRDLCHSKGLTRSVDTLDRILARGKLYQSYDFFGL